MRTAASCFERIRQIDQPAVDDAGERRFGELWRDPFRDVAHGRRRRGTSAFDPSGSVMVIRLMENELAKSAFAAAPLRRGSLRRGLPEPKLDACGADRVSEGW